jgi:hypothetical protein
LDVIVRPLGGHRNEIRSQPSRGRGPVPRDEPAEMKDEEVEFVSAGKSERTVAIVIRPGWA